jgi:hypothetical protein
VSASASVLALLGFGQFGIECSGNVLALLGFVSFKGDCSPTSWILAVLNLDWLLSGLLYLKWAIPK